MTSFIWRRKVPNLNSPGRFRDFVQDLPFDYAYSEGPGDHTWGYWDAQIQNVLDWLPLPKK